MTPKVRLGRILATPAALDALQEAKLPADDYLQRHGNADWGDLDEEDGKANDRALEEGGRLLSSYRLPTGATLWIITEADRSSTTLLIPADY